MYGGIIASVLSKELYVWSDRSGTDVSKKESEEDDKIRAGLAWTSGVAFIQAGKQVLVP